MHESRLYKVGIESLSDDFQTLFRHYDNLVQALLTCFYDRDKIIPGYDNERLYHVNLLTQKFLLHCHATKNILLGYNLNLKNVPPIHIFDPFSVFVLKRALIENYLTINYLTLSTNNEEAELRFKIWMMFGLSKRDCSELKSEMAKNVHASDLKSIESLDQEIRQSEYFRRLSHEKQISLFKTFKRDWKIIFKANGFTVASWQKLIDYTGMNEVIRNDIYNFLSWHSHSQSISTLQLEEMYDSGMDLLNVKLSTKKLSIFVAFLLNDLIILDKGYEESYKHLTDYQKEIITFYNHAFRDTNHIYEKIEE
jgi:hypothetical protein